jgi:hypothetical protein
MEELKINSKETKDFFIHAFNEETLVPILGAGFTRGVNTGRGGKVPSGKELKDAMIEKISRKKLIRVNWNQSNLVLLLNSIRIHLAIHLKMELLNIILKILQELK